MNHCRTCVGQECHHKECRAGDQITHSRGECRRVLKLRIGWEGFLGKRCCCQPDSGNPTVRDERGACGNVMQGLAPFCHETWKRPDTLVKSIDLSMRESRISTRREAANNEIICTVCCPTADPLATRDKCRSSKESNGNRHLGGSRSMDPSIQGKIHRDNVGKGQLPAGTRNNLQGPTV